MEALYLYLIKSSGLIALFYLVYILMLRKETFFNSNRWFLLLGLCTAVVLPLMVYTKIIVVQTAVTKFDWSKMPVINSIEEQPIEINWYLIFAIIYGVGMLVFLIKFLFDFYSLSLVFKGKTIKYQANLKFIDTTENVAPFSYFNTIVYNSSLYSASELANILEHEKVHCEQNHTVDLLITRVFCIVFWFNPIIWWYKKSILQNLEFIADNEATKKISDKKAYQFTLLKITTHENCVAITNHFYQSLIKKRIVMLNKNQSKKRNSWKYAIVLPALFAFVLLYQVKTIAQEKTVQIQSGESKQNVSNPVDIYKINKNTTDTELKEKAAAINTNYGIKVTFSKIKRNTNNELIAIRVALKKGKEISKEMETEGTEPIKAFDIVISKNAKGLLEIDFTTEDKTNNATQVGIVAPDAPLSAEKEYFIDGVKVNENELDKLKPNDIESVNVIKNSNTKELRIVTNKQPKTDTSKEYEIDDDVKTLVLVNGKKVAADVKLNEIDQKNVVSVKVSKIIEKIKKQVQKNASGPAKDTAKLKEGYKIGYETFDAADNIKRIQNNKNVDYKKAIIIINGKTSDYEVLNKINSEDIVSVGIQQPANLPEALKLSVLKIYGEKALNGIITITTKEFQKK